MRKTRLLPVIHHLDARTTLQQADVAMSCGADGVFLISHQGDDRVLPSLGAEIKDRYPSSMVGLNFLTLGPLLAFEEARRHKLDAVWGDSCGVDSRGTTGLALDLSLSAFTCIRPVTIYAGVAFKYSAPEDDPAGAAANALKAGFRPTTSGAATGVAAPVDKIRSMSTAVHGALAIASGITPENYADYHGLLSDVLVSTGVSRDEHHFEPERLKKLAGLVKQPVFREPVRVTGG